MYYYIYDNFLIEKKYQGIISKIESRLTDLGINGKIIRMSTFKNLSKTLNEDIAKGVKTLVVVGNDRTLNQLINLINNLNLTIGLIPLGPDNNIARLMGIPEGEAACDVLSSRIIQPLHLGLINKKYFFITYLELPGDNIYLNCDENYFINVCNYYDAISISNIFWGEDTDKIPLSNNSGYINLIIKHIKKGLFQTKKENFSYFKIKTIELTSDRSVPILLIDEKRIVKTPVTVSVAKNKLNLIVGRKRLISWITNNNKISPNKSGRFYYYLIIA